MVRSYIHQKKHHNYKINIDHNKHTPVTVITNFTAGSLTETGVSSAYCVTEGTWIINQSSSRLDENNRVYQAKLFVILQALEWINIQTDTALQWIYSGSLSSLQSLNSHKNKHTLVLISSKIY